MSDDVTNEVPVENNSAAPSSAELDTLRQRAETAERELALRKALGTVDWFDPEDAYRELAAKAERDAEGNWIVATSPPAPLLEGEGGRAAAGVDAPAVTRMPLSEAAKQLAARKPHWVRARVFGGSGAGGSSGGAVSSAITYAELLRPENAAKLREYVHERREELERLRAAHFGV